MLYCVCSYGCCAGDSQAYQQAWHLNDQQTTKGSAFSCAIILSLWLRTSTTWQIQVRDSQLTDLGYSVWYEQLVISLVTHLY